MTFFKNIFSRKEAPINSYNDFWNWFQNNEKAFFNIVKSREDVEKHFFDKLSSKLSELKDGYFYLAGIYNDTTVELVFTADGNTKNIVFIEELVEQAPGIKGWKFTALKPAIDIENVVIEMGGYTFKSDNLSFYSNDHDAYPDEIDISVIHNDLTEENRELISNGTYVFLDNYLGELDFLNNIDNLKIFSRQEAEKEAIPMAKLKDFLTWRQREFIEKYEDVHYNIDDDQHAVLEAELKNGNKLIAIMNMQLLAWDGKASHPWIAAITLKYDGSNNNGMPNNDDYQLLNEIEDAISKELSDKEGYLNIGRQTADNEREIYFACKEFRKPSKVFYKTKQDAGNKFHITYDIYKDKYWQSFERFRAGY